MAQACGSGLTAATENLLSPMLLDLPNNTDSSHQYQTSGCLYWALTPQDRAFVHYEGQEYLSAEIADNEYSTSVSSNSRHFLALFCCRRCRHY